MGYPLGIDLSGPSYKLLCFRKKRNVINVVLRWTPKMRQVAKVEPCP